MNFAGTLGKFFGKSSSKNDSSSSSSSSSPNTNEKKESGGFMDTVNNLFQTNPTELPAKSDDKSDIDNEDDQSNVPTTSTPTDEHDDDDDDDDDDDTSSIADDETEHTDDERDAELHFTQVFNEKIITPTITVNCIVYFPCKYGNNLSYTLFLLHKNKSTKLYTFPSFTYDVVRYNERTEQSDGDDDNNPPNQTEDSDDDDSDSSAISLPPQHVDIMNKCMHHVISLIQLPVKDKATFSEDSYKGYIYDRKHERLSIILDGSLIQDELEKHKKHVLLTKDEILHDKVIGDIRIDPLVSTSYFRTEEQRDNQERPPSLAGILSKNEPRIIYPCIIQKKEESNSTEQTGGGATAFDNVMEGSRKFFDGFMAGTDESTTDKNTDDAKNDTTDTDPPDSTTNNENTTNDDDNDIDNDNDDNDSDDDIDMSSWEAVYTTEATVTIHPILEKRYYFTETPIANASQKIVKTMLFIENTRELSKKDLSDILDKQEEDDEKEDDTNDTDEDDDEDDTNTPTEQSSTETPTEEATEQSSTETPTEEPIAEPTDVSPTEQSSTETPTEEPTEQSSTEEPTETPMEEPTDASPTEQSSTETPTEENNTVKDETFEESEKRIKDEAEKELDSDSESDSESETDKEKTNTDDTPVQEQPVNQDVQSNTEDTAEITTEQPVEGSPETKTENQEHTIPAPAPESDSSSDSENASSDSLSLNSDTDDSDSVKSESSKSSESSDSSDNSSNDSSSKSSDNSDDSGNSDNDEITQEEKLIQSIKQDKPPMFGGLFTGGGNGEGGEEQGSTNLVKDTDIVEFMMNNVNIIGIPTSYNIS